ncbi:MAG: universal stress protein [Planctomycetes bacterium]|jgi:hypothetical protein|nr:universal stress protein [Planctomycetota bacterium]
MTVLSFRNIGLCAQYSPTGDRALRYALGLARHHGVQLNIFSFLHDPFTGTFGAEPELAPADRERRLVQADQALREYYDGRLGDALDVGFRVCEGSENVELRRCLKRGEYQILVMPYLDRGGRFGDLPIEEFAMRFLAPVVLVGRGRRVRYYLNPQAVILGDKLNLFKGSWRPLHSVDQSCEIG